MKGKIVKGISGFYYVHVAETGIYECKAKGIFRNQKIKPLVGDDVEIVVLDEEKKIGNVEKILPRTRELIRPAVANIDMALVIFAAAKPDPNFNLLDRFLCMMEYQKVPVTICFNKCDLVTEEQREVLRKIYELAGYELLFTSAKTQENVEKLKSVLQGKMTAVAGPSGVGKSSLINRVEPGLSLKIAEISDSHDTGKHTTTFAEMFPLSFGGSIIDTPGIRAFGLIHMEKTEISHYFPEIFKRAEDCRFYNCTHIHEPGCAVIQAVEDGEISESRYFSYVSMFEEGDEKYRK